MVGTFRIPNLPPRSLVHIVGCSSRGRGNCGKLRATSNRASQARDTEFSKRCANGGKTTASTCQFSSRTTYFSTVCIVRQFPWPAFDWRHLPIYRMNQFVPVRSPSHASNSPSDISRASRGSLAAGDVCLLKGWSFRGAVSAHAVKLTTPSSALILASSQDSTRARPCRNPWLLVRNSLASVTSAVPYAGISLSAFRRLR